MPPRSKKDTILSQEDLALKGLEYNKLKQDEKKLKGMIAKVREPLEEAVSHSDTEDSNGNKIVVVSHGDMDVCLTHTLRRGKQMLPEILDVLKEEGLDDCIETVEVVREDRIEALCESGKISEEVLRKMYSEKPSWAFSVKVNKRV